MIKFKKKKNNFTYYALGVQDSQGVPDCVDVVLEGKVLLNVPHGTSAVSWWSANLLISIVYSCTSDWSGQCAQKLVWSSDLGPGCLEDILSVLASLYPRYLLGQP